MDVWFRGKFKRWAHDANNLPSIYLLVKPKEKYSDIKPLLG